MLKPYESYKKTNIPWLKEVPSHWELKRGKHIFENKKTINKDNIYTDVLSLTLKGVIDNNGKKPIGLSPKDYATYQLFNKNDLVFKLIDLENLKTSRVGLVKRQGIMSSAYIRLVQRNENSNSKYFYFQYYDLYLRAVFNGLGAGVRSTMSASDLMGINLVIPPRTEQDQIVKYLDWQTSKINTLIVAKKKEIKLLKEQKQAVINKAVTKGLDDSVSMKDSGIEWLGEVPKHWESRFLFQIAKEQGLSNKGMISDNLLSLSYGRIINKNINKTDGLLPISFESYQIVKNGNIILRLTDLQNDHKSLRVGLVTQKGIITSAYTCLKCQSNVHSQFLYNLLHSYDICKLFYGMGGGVRQSIGYKDISKIICFCPPLEEQQAIVTYLEEKTALIDKAISVIEKEIELLSEYKTSLISSVVTGKIDVSAVVVPKFDIIEESMEDEEIEEIEENIEEEC